MGNIRVSDYKRLLRYVDRLEKEISKTQEKIKMMMNVLNEMDKNLLNVVASKNMPD